MLFRQVIPPTSVKIMGLWDLLKTFCVGTGPSVNFRQPSVHPRDNLLSICASAGTSVNFVNFQCRLGTFRQHFLRPWDLLSTSVNFPCLHGAFGQLIVRLRDFPSTFPVNGGPSVNFSCIRRTLCASRTFCASAGLYINLSCVCGTVRKLPSTFRASWDLL